MKQMQGNQPSDFNQLVFKQMAISIERWQTAIALDEFGQ